MLSLQLVGSGATETVTLSSVSLEPTFQELECTFCTAEPRSQVERPLALSYDFTSIQLLTTQSGTSPNPGELVQFSSATVELPVVPSFLLIITHHLCEREVSSLQPGHF